MEFDGGVLLLIRGLNLEEPAVSNSTSKSTVIKTRQTTVKGSQAKEGY